MRTFSVFSRVSTAPFIKTVKRAPFIKAVKPAPFVKTVKPAPFVKVKPTGLSSNRLKILGRLDKRKSPVTQIVIKPKSKHPALLGTLQGQKAAESFSNLYLREDVVSALEEIGVAKPTVIQMLAIPKIVRGRNVLCASETGSGKTLAYLAPLVSRLKDEADELGVMTRLTRPRALVVLPSRDLATQVLRVAKSLCHRARFRVAGLIGGMKRRIIRDALENPIDVAVVTPDALLKLKRKDKVLLNDVSHLVLDEADTLFDKSFRETTLEIIKCIKVRSKKPAVQLAREDGAQVTIVGATLSEEMLAELEGLVPNIKKVSSKHLHQVLPHVEQRFLAVKQMEKPDKLLAVLRSRPSDVFIVFCNTVPTCDFISHHVATQGINVVKLHGGFSALNRKNLLKTFLEGDSRVLICTDIASRGIDSSKVNHIVLFDFPLNLPDYLHRVGRTGRVGSTVKNPQVTAFMSHRRDIQMAWKIKDAADRQEAILSKKAVNKLQGKHDGEGNKSRLVTNTTTQLIS